MFSKCSQENCRIFSGWKIQRNSMIPNYSMIPAIRWSQLFNDPQLFHDQLEVWILIIQKSTVIPPSLMVLLIISSIVLFTFGVIVFLLVSLVLSCICISISMGDGWMHPECWFTDAICSCGKWSVSNSDREKRRKRRKRKENYFLFRSSYHAVPRNFDYLFY